MKKYDPKKIEAKWQKYWLSKKIFVAKDSGHKEMVLIEFPYPSGAGLHMGHMRPFIAGDVASKYWKLRGRNVMYPIGWDAFGLPAENYAIKNKVHPSVSTAQNIKNAKKQLLSWGTGFDWKREINTTDPNYYKWTQKLFLEFYKAGLAYEKFGEINWCPKDMTGLANEEVVDGKCERCGAVAEKKSLRQWYLKITDYAEKLLEGLKDLPEWPEAVKIQQANWIGKSEGAEIDFKIELEKNKPRFVIIHGYKGSTDKNFIPWLKNELESRGHEVEAPELPNTNNPKESEQVEYVLSNCKLDDNTVVIGHSLGAVVAVKAITKLNQPISGLVLVGAAMDPKFHTAKSRPFWKDFSWDYDYEKVIKLAQGRIAVLSDLKEKQRAPYLKFLSEKLSAVLIEVYARKEHFCDTEEPSILDCVTPHITVFTTRADTLFGATYLVLAPEHPWVEELIPRLDNENEIRKYIEFAKNKTEVERTADGKEKTGIELKGLNAINPASGEKIPIWISDYVLANYGTGAIMAVPAHDERDKQFAEKYRLPIADKPLVQIDEAIKKYGKKITKYKLRDWVFSRQRYWGEPIPLIHCDKCGIVPVPEKDLPVKLPNVKRYEPTGTGESPLAAVEKWVNTKCPDCKSKAKRETNTMPQWAGSSWYWLRYMDAKNKKEFASLKNQKYWSPVDLYFGGMEHTTLHLLYSRFWNLFLHDRELASVKEPYKKRVPHGIILGPDGEKMSKSRGNVVNPDELVALYGADTVRLYMMFLGPHESQVAWNDKGIVGCRRFLERAFAMQEFMSSHEPKEVTVALHKMIKKVGEDIEKFAFNTAISAMMIFVNTVYESKSISRDSYKAFLAILSPFAPHIAEEMWSNLGSNKSIYLTKWPSFDDGITRESNVVIAVQINGKTRAEIQVPQDETDELVKAAALASPKVQGYTKDKDIRRIIVVKNRLINIVL